jgi:hypothetical protein
MLRNIINILLLVLFIRVFKCNVSVTWSPNVTLRWDILSIEIA